MIRLGTLFWLVLVSATGFAMFGVKYQVQALEDELARTNRATVAEEHEIRVLEAEWAYLTRPETLEAMNRQFLSLGPISTKQLHTTVADIPMRPPPPPPRRPGAGRNRRGCRGRRAGSAASRCRRSAPEGVPVRLRNRRRSSRGRAAGDAKRAARDAGLAGEAGGGAPARQGRAGQGGREAQPTRAGRKSLDDLIAQIMTSR